MIRKNKFGNKKKRCLSGHIHDSKGEAGYCNELLARKQSGEIMSYMIQAVFELQGGIKHVVDFFVFTKNYTWEVHEFKGFKTAVWRMKEKLFKEKYPGISYRVITNERRQICRKRKMSGSKKILKRIRVWR